MTDDRFAQFKHRDKADPQLRRMMRDDVGLQLRKSKRDSELFRRRHIHERAIEVTCSSETISWDAIPAPSPDTLEELYALCTTSQPPPDICIRLTPWMVWIDSEIHSAPPVRRRLMIGVISAMADSKMLMDMKIQLMKILVEVVERCMDDPFSLSMASYGISSLLDNEDFDSINSLVVMFQAFWVVEALVTLWKNSSDMIILWDVAASARKLAKAGAPHEVIFPLFAVMDEKLRESIFPEWLKEGLASERTCDTIYLSIDAMRHFVRTDVTFSRRYNLTKAALLLMGHHHLLLPHHASLIRVSMMSVLALLDGHLEPMEMDRGLFPCKDVSPKRMYTIFEHLALHHMIIRDLMGIIHMSEDAGTAGYAVTVLTSLVTHTASMALDAADTGMHSEIKLVSAKRECFEMDKAVFMLYALTYRKTNGFLERPILRAECAELAVQQIESEGCIRPACRLLAELAENDIDLFQRMLGHGDWAEKVMRLSMEKDDDAVANLADVISAHEKTFEDDWEILPQ